VCQGRGGLSCGAADQGTAASVRMAVAVWSPIERKVIDSEAVNCQKCN
jgi:hypothetical protein